MNNILIIFITSIISSAGKYIDKKLVNLGITKKDYFYYMCLSMVPFSIFMCGIEYINGSLKFNLNIISIILLILAMIFRYIKQNKVVACLKYLNPYEDSAYLSLGLIIAYVIDMILKIEIFNIYKLFSIIFILVGVFLLSNTKLKIKNLKKDLFIKIMSSIVISYTIHFLLYYLSAAVILLLVNLILTIAFSRDYNLKYHKGNQKIIKWVFIQQTFGFAYTYLIYYLTFKSVTLSSFVMPVTLMIIMIISLLFKENEKRATPKQCLAIIIISMGIFLIN